MKDFVPRILAPEKLVMKEIQGQKITAKELLEYFKVGFLFHCLEVAHVFIIIFCMYMYVIKTFQIRPDLHAQEV